MKGIPTIRLRPLKRSVVLLGVGALVAGASVLGATAAHAALGTQPGTLALSPTSGPTSTTPNYSTTIACPVGNQGSAIVKMVDPGTSATTNASAVNPSVAAAFSGKLNAPFTTFEQVFPDIAGATTELVVFCFTGPSATGTSVPVMDTFVNISADGSTYTETSNSGPTATTTTLSASPSPATVGQTVTLTATVTASSGTPAGTVQFEVGGTAIGSPVSVASGVASTTTSFSAAGTEALSAMFTPTDSTAFGSSTGNFSLTVQTPAANSGTEPLAVTVPASGSFTLTVGTGTVNLTVSGSSATGALNPVTVSDTRNTFPGWSVSGQASDFAGSGSAAGGAISGNELGWTPTSTTLATGVSLGGTVTPGSPGLGSTAAVLASVHAGLNNGFGTSTFGANLNLSIPATAPAGPYTSTLTVTAVTSNP